MNWGRDWLMFCLREWWECCYSFWLFLSSGCFDVYVLIVDFKDRAWKRIKVSRKNGNYVKEIEVRIWGDFNM